MLYLTLPALFYPKKGFFQLLPLSCKDNLLVLGRTPLSKGLCRERTDCISHRYCPLKGQLSLHSCPVRKASLPLEVSVLQSNIQTCSVPWRNYLGNVKLFKRTGIMFSKILIKMSYHSWQIGGKKGEGKQDKEKILILAITYFSWCLPQPCWSRAWAAPQGAATADWPRQPWNQNTSQPPAPVQVHRTGWSNRGAKKSSVCFGRNQTLGKPLKSSKSPS